MTKKEKILAQLAKLSANDNMKALVLERNILRARLEILDRLYMSNFHAFSKADRVLAKVIKLKPHKAVKQFINPRGLTKRVKELTPQQAEKFIERLRAVQGGEL